MNRRGFFQSTLGLIAGAIAAPFLPKRSVPSVRGINQATYKFWRNQQFDGATVATSVYCPPNTLYFLNSNAFRIENISEPVLHSWDVSTIRRLGNGIIHQTNEAR